jgi:hypothetical protein
VTFPGYILLIGEGGIYRIYMHLMGQGLMFPGCFLFIGEGGVPRIYSSDRRGWYLQDIYAPHGSRIDVPRMVSLHR